MICIVRLCVGLVAAFALTPGAGAEEAYPSKPIHVIVPYPAGGVVDTFARVLTEGIARHWQQPTFIVDPRPGASASLGTQLALRAQPDGYTWLIGSSSLIANPLLFKSSNWNPLTSICTKRLKASPRSSMSAPGKRTWNYSAESTRKFPGSLPAIPFDSARS